MTNSYYNIKTGDLHKILKKKVKELCLARENKDYFREMNILYDISRIEDALEKSNKYE